MAPGFSSLTLTPNNDVKITRSGNLALATLTFHFAAKQKDGAALEFDARHTQSFFEEKRGGKWLIIMSMFPSRCFKTLQNRER